MRLLALFATTAGAFLSLASASDVKVHKKEFPRPPNFLFYFEDSPVVMSLFVDSNKGDVWRSADNGASWEVIKGPDGKALDMLEHPHDPKRAVILGDGTKHWKTSDRGETWEEFEVDLPISSVQNTLAFHSERPDYVLYAGRECEKEAFFEICEDYTYYTTDWFKTTKPLKKRTKSCIFAKGRKNFAHGEDKTVLCVVDDVTKFHEHRLLEVSDNFEDWRAPKFDGINLLKGVNGLAAVEKFIVAAIRSKGTDEMALYVTEDVKVWTRAEFPHDHGGLKEGAYTILESTPYSIQVDVLSSDSNPLRPSGSMFTSNSNGTYFIRNIDHTNRIEEGLVDFEKVEGIEGIVLVNVVKNWDAKDPRKKKQIQSRISFDDGRADTWKPLKAAKKDLHLFSVTAFRNMGRVYSSKAPGLIMGVGNTGDHLEDYTDGDLYVSIDAGLNWEKALSEAHIYEFGGAGSILVAVYDEGPTDEARYSIDYGKTWEKVDLGVKVHTRILTTTPDSTSLNFVLVGMDKDKKGQVISLDFNDVLDRKCKLDKENPGKSDFEKWYARYDEDKKPDCLMGHKEFYWRRKRDAKCNAGDLYKEPEVEEEVCECQDHDFECDFNFIRDNDGKCVLAPGAKLSIPSGQCKKPGDKYKGPSGYRKIPGNTCKAGVSKDEKIERDCDEANAAPPASGEIKVKFEDFKGKTPLHYFYLENAETSSKMDETIFMRTEKQEIWVSHDGGFEWRKPKELVDVQVLDIYNNPYNYDHIYVLTGSRDLYVSVDRGRSFRKHQAPSPPNKERLAVLDFHPKNPGWLIWIGQEPDCRSTKCRSVAYATRDIAFGEKGWKPLLSNVGKCQWIRGQKQKIQSEKLIFCARIQESFDPPKVNVQLLSSEDFFKSEPTVHFEDIIGFAKMEEFIVVASVNNTNGYLKASASIDGRTFAPANFPYNLNVPHQTAYTVLDSITHAVFLHVTTNDAEGFEFGSLLKSNSNGTDYVLALDGVNRNELGFVDFEKMHSLEGVILVNRVVNKDDVVKKSTQKKLRTMISRNDGALWTELKPPTKDSNGKPYSCSGSTKECSLNLHHYTERSDPRHTFGSPSGVGLMLGIGNVGDHLNGFADGDTFMTRDGGMTWKEIKKGQYLWEYGDQGSIIVIVDRSKPTDTVHYTLDEGQSWVDFKFGQKLKVFDISTVPSDTSRKFILWGQKEGGGDKFYTAHLDFRGITNQQCVFAEDENKQDDDDFELWTPLMEGDDCLFGHVAQYNRKIPSHRCYVGRKIPTFHKVLKNCSCTPADFECDFNYERVADNNCRLIPGLSPPNKEQVCSENPDLIEWYMPTGFRRLPMTTCQGGLDWDKGESKPCPGKQEEYEKKHRGLGGFGLFMAIVIPIIAAAAIGWYVWTQLLQRQFGAIRLGEENRESPFIQYPIIALAAVIAVAAAIPEIVGAIGRWVGSKITRQRRYTTRSSFARGGDYSVVNTDEGELLGSDDEDEV